jgi:hypothetical protein
MTAKHTPGPWYVDYDGQIGSDNLRTTPLIPDDDGLADQVAQRYEVHECEEILKSGAVAEAYESFFVWVLDDGSVLDSRGEYTLDEFEAALKICANDGPLEDLDPAEQAANARLMAAAPDLLQELSWIRQFIHKHPENQGEVVIRNAKGSEWWDWIDRCDAAIAKATGGDK